MPSQINLIATLILVTSGCVLAHAADWQDGLQRMGTDGDFQAPYRLYLPPEQQSKGQELPLVIYLHGQSRRGSDNIWQVSNSDEVQGLLDATQSKDRPAYFLVPQVPADSDMVNQGRAVAMRNALVDMLLDTVDEYPIDPTRIYLTGYSMGSFSTYSMLFADPNLFAAAMPVAGGWGVNSVDPFVHVPLWGFHGAKDTTNPIDGIGVGYDGHQAIIDTLRSKGGTPRFTVTDDGHDVSKIYSDGRYEYYEWLSGQHNPDVGIAGVTHVGGWKEIGTQILTEQQNFALAGTASASASHPRSGPEKAIDGNRSSRFRMDGEAQEHWWQLELPEQQPVDKITMFSRANGFGLLDGGGFRALAFDENGSQVFAQDFVGEPAQDPLVIELGSLLPVERIRIERLHSGKPRATFQLAEVELTGATFYLQDVSLISGRNFAGTFSQRDDLLHVELDASKGQSDLLVGNTLEIDGGNLKVLLLDGELNAGDTFDILDFETVLGTFAEMEFPRLQDGLSWDTSRLYSDGSIAVAVPEPSVQQTVWSMLLLVFVRFRQASRRWAQVATDDASAP